MPQLQLPFFPVGTTSITPELAFERRENQIVYFNGQLPVFVHEAADVASFRLFTTQLIVNGTATQSQITKAFGVPSTTVKRCVKRYREGGGKVFFAPPLKRKGNKLTPERLKEVQALLDEGTGIPAISAQMGILASTLHKAVDCGRLRQVKKIDGAALTQTLTPVVSTKSQRSAADGEAAMGVGTLRTMDRLAAAVGALEAAPLEFESVDDVPMGGVLCALPALLSLGLLRHSRDHFSLPKGFYPIETIFLVLSFLALARIRSLESLRYQAPGEWGKLLGLDRIPEVKTMREKLSLLVAEPGQAQKWSSQLAKEWMTADPETAGTLYIDGHVRVYHGDLTKLPRHYVTRQRLCLRSTTDYWVNAMDGQPFFVVTQAVDPGMVSVLREQIVPRLKTDVPGQPNAERLAENQLLHRFTLVCDRESYSPVFFKEMRAERIAVVTYHKFPDEPWAEEEFSLRPVTLVSGEHVVLALAERGVRLSNHLWVRELRHRDSRGHQTSILSTDYVNNLDRIAVAMFARWCQENFFKYMLEHYGLDRLIEYGTEPIPETTRVVNPDWRSLDAQVRKEVAILSREKAAFGALHLPEDADTDAAETHEQQKGQILVNIQNRQQQIADLKERRKKTPHHVTIKDLKETERFSQLQTDKKHLVDTIKMISYRAETMLAHLAKEKLSRAKDEARAWVRGLLSSTVDLRPDPIAKTLTVRLHRQATAAQDEALRHLCAELTATETVYPQTDLRLIFEPIGISQFPPGQEF